MLEGVAVTCYHVISGNPSGALKVRLPRDTKDYVAELLYEHQGHTVLTPAKRMKVGDQAD